VDLLRDRSNCTLTNQSSPATLVLIWIRGRDEIGNAGQIPFYKVVVMLFQMIGNYGVKIPPCKMESALHSQDLYVNDWCHAGKWGFSAIYTVKCTVWQKWTVPREFPTLSASRRGAVCWVWAFGQFYDYEFVVVAGLVVEILLIHAKSSAGVLFV
jgi:hypothetical protein